MMGMIEIKKRNGKFQAFRACDISSIAEIGEKTVVVVKGDTEPYTIDADYKEILKIWKLATNEQSIYVT